MPRAGPEGPTADRRDPSPEGLAIPVAAARVALYRTRVPRLEWSHLGCVDYGVARRLQEHLADERRAGRIDDLLLLLEHPPIVTVGRNGRDPFAGTSRPAGSVSCVRVDRGGAATYHGPGQLVIYPVVALKSEGRGVRRFVDELEEALCAVAREHGVAAVRRAGFPGAWVEDGRPRKLGSVGISVRRGVSLHGAALNVTRASVHGFAGFDPCDLPGVVATSLEDETPGWIPGLGRVAETFAGCWARIAGYGSADRVAIDLDRVVPGPGSRAPGAPEDEVTTWT